MLLARELRLAFSKELTTSTSLNDCVRLFQSSDEITYILSISSFSILHQNQAITYGSLPLTSVSQLMISSGILSAFRQWSHTSISLTHFSGLIQDASCYGDGLLSCYWFSNISFTPRLQNNMHSPGCGVYTFLSVQVSRRL